MFSVKRNTYISWDSTWCSCESGRYYESDDFNVNFYVSVHLCMFGVKIWRVHYYVIKLLKDLDFYENLDYIKALQITNKYDGGGFFSTAGKIKYMSPENLN